MPNKCFEDLEIWQEARRLTNNMYAITKRETFSKDFGFRDQIRQASVSIVSNIAEGYEREENQELSQFLSIAKGSCGKVRSQLYIALDQGYIDAKECEALIIEFKKLSVSIHNFINHPEKTTSNNTSIDEQPKRGSIKKELEAIFDEVDKEKV
ncbi:MAG: four helix bundle protein [Proteobacteria bacterium]|nr:four helix bundle protein [Pseudomonadota bacterium]